MCQKIIRFRQVILPLWVLIFSSVKLGWGELKLVDFKLLLNSEILSSNAIVYQCTKQTAPNGAPSSSFLMMAPEVFPSLTTPRAYDSL